MIIDFIGLLIVTVVALFVIYPLLEPRFKLHGESSERGRDLARDRDILMREIAELDFDHRLGKVTDTDYQDQRSEYLEEAAGVLKELDEQTRSGRGIPPVAFDSDDAVEREIRRLRARTEQEMR